MNEGISRVSVAQVVNVKNGHQKIVDRFDDSPFLQPKLVANCLKPFFMPFHAAQRWHNEVFISIQHDIEGF